MTTWLDDIEARLRLVDEHGSEADRSRRSVADLRRLLRVARAAEAHRQADERYLEALERAFSSAAPAPEGDLLSARAALDATKDELRAALEEESR